MNIEKLSIKQIKDLMVKDCNEELLTAIKNDVRKGVQSIYKNYQREMKERQRVANLYTFENECRANGYKLIAGVDEVGRGPLAGPVVVASVILPENFFIEKINDSKKLSEATREKIYDIIMENAIAVNRAIIDEKTIDRVNIYEVTNLAQTINYLKKNNYWIIGTDMEGTDYKDIDYKGKIVIIIGNEGNGMSRLVKESCDFIATIPMQGEVNSLNASVAAGIIIFETRR